MPKIAVDIVLLPSEEVAKTAIEANRELLKQWPDKIVLDREACLPHVSLAMGCIDSSDIAPIKRILEELATRSNPGALVSLGVHAGTNAAGEKVSVLALERTEALQRLHEHIMHELEPYCSHDARAEMVLSPPEAGESTVRWIREYPEKSSFGRFFPHITLGYGQLDDFVFPAEFTPIRLALCHLGNHCTCRKILASAKFPV